MFLGENSDIMRGPYRDKYDGIQIKIESKKLKSGKCQVKSFAYGLASEDCYGYILVNAEQTLREVVWEIKTKLVEIGDLERYYQRHLFSIKQNVELKDEFLLFKK